MLCKAATVRQHLRENLRLIQSPLTSARVEVTIDARADAVQGFDKAFLASSVEEHFLEAEVPWELEAEAP